MVRIDAVGLGAIEGIPAKRLQRVLEQVPGPFLVTRESPGPTGNVSLGIYTPGGAYVGWIDLKRCMVNWEDYGAHPEQEEAPDDGA